MIGGERRTVAALFRDYCAFAGWRLAGALLLMVAGAVAEGAGVLMIVPLVAIAAGTDRLPPMLDSISALFAAVPTDQRLFLAVGLFIAAMTARAALLYARDVLLARLLVGHEASMQVRAAATLAGRGWPFASRVGQSGMQSLLLTDIPRASSAVNYGQHGVVCAIMLGVQFGLAAWLSPIMALIVLLAIVLGYALSWRWIVRGRDSGLAITEHSDRSAGVAFRLHAGLKAALAQGTVPQFVAEYGTSLDRLSAQFNRFAGDTAVVRAGASIASALAAAALLIVGDRLLDLPFPVLMALIVLFARMSGPAQQLQQSVQMVAATAPAFDAVEHRIGGLQAAVPPSAPAEPLTWSNVRLDRATYEHAPGLGARGASLALRRGEWIGIDGDSGAGKTSLIDLIVGLTPPTSGTVEIDGVALNDELLERWRRGIAYVGQADAVLDDSVRGNLLAGGGAGDEPALWDALDSVGLSDRVRRFPAGLDESVGDRGSSLSGGERQRLGLARAILRCPSLLILDEATSALDRRSEEALLQKLRALNPRPAALLVAHRDSTLAMCDTRLTVRGGTLLGPGEGNTLDPS